VIRTGYSKVFRKKKAEHFAKLLGHKQFKAIVMDGLKILKNGIIILLLEKCAVKVQLSVMMLSMNGKWATESRYINLAFYTMYQYIQC